MKVSASVSTPARAGGRGFGSLDGEEDAVEGSDSYVEITGQGAQMRFVGGGVAGIGDDHETLLAEPGDDEVVEHAGLIVQEQCVFGLRGRDRGGIERAGAVEQGDGARPFDLKHFMSRCRTGRRARAREVFLMTPPARSAASPSRQKARTSRRRPCNVLRGGGVFASSPVKSAPKKARMSRRSDPFVPLCLKPERLARPITLAALTPSARGIRASTFQSVVSRQRFFCLRDFGRFPLRRQLSLLSPANGRAEAPDVPSIAQGRRFVT